MKYKRAVITFEECPSGAMSTKIKFENITTYEVIGLLEILKPQLIENSIERGRSLDKEYNNQTA